MSQVWDLQTESLTQKLVLLALADNANDQGVCWPSIPSLAKKTQMSDRGIQKQLVALQARGWISLSVRFDKSGDRSSNLYRIHIPQVVNTVHHLVNGVREGGEPGAPGVVNTVHPESSIESSMNRKGGVPHEVTRTPVTKALPKKYPSEAFKAMAEIRRDIEEIKESGSSSKWRDKVGVLLPEARQELIRLRESLAKNKKIACE